MARSVNIGGAKVTLSGDSAELEKALGKVSTAFQKQELALQKAQRRADRTGKSFAALTKHAKAFAGIAIGAAVAGFSAAGFRAADASAKFGASLAEVSMRLGVLPSQLYAIRNAFEDDGVAIAKTDQNLTALSRRFAANAPKLRETAEKVGIAWHEWRETGGDLAKLMPIIAEAMAGTATQAEKLNFLQEAGSSSARVWLTALQRADFSKLTGQYREQAKSLDVVAGKLKDYDQVITNVARAEQLQAAEAVAKNTEAYGHFALLMSDLKLKAIEAASFIGKLYGHMKQLLDYAAEEARKHGNVEAVARGGDTRGARLLQSEEDAKKLARAYRRAKDDLNDLQAAQRAGLPNIWESDIDRAVEKVDELAAAWRRLTETAGKGPQLIAPRHVEADVVGKADAAMPEGYEAPSGDWSRWARYGAAVEKATEIAKEGAEERAQAAETAAEREKRALEAAANSMEHYQAQVWAAIANRQAEAQEIAEAEIREAHEKGIEDRKRQEEEYAEWYEQMLADRIEAVRAAKEAEREAVDEFIDRIKIDMEDFSNTFKSLIAELIREVARLALTGQSEALSGLWSLIGGGGGYVSPGNPHRQYGGPVQAGRAYVVGEAGPELFVAGASGFVTPNDRLAAMGGGGTTVNFSPIIQGAPDPAAIRTQLDAAFPEFARRVRAMDLRDGRRNSRYRGVLAKAPREG